MSKRAKVACAGDLLVEFVATERNLRHRRATTYAGPFPSGAAGIFIDQAAQVGAQCLFVGAVGDDAFGDVVMDRLTAHGVDARLIGRIAGVPTGTAFVSYDDDGARDFVYNIALSAAARFDAGPAALAALRDFRPDAFHVSGSALGDPTMAAKVLAICRSLREAGTAIAFDPNLRKELAGDPGYFTAVEEALAMCSTFLPSETDAEALFPGRSFEGMCADLFAKGVGTVVLKKGDEGCEGATARGETARFDAHRVDALDPTGAGDCFCATFVALRAAGHSLAHAMERANAAGALAVGAIGPMEGNSSLERIESFLATRA
ncbi:MAG: sugar kinase [Hyphomicrobiales bacterium]|nr:sugar kinase [Hyphomicrobiales bacterium]MDE2016461.1 sugar kinase [Hyphomicrobiales bacterium]